MGQNEPEFEKNHSYLQTTAVVEAKGNVAAGVIGDKVADLVGAMVAVEEANAVGCWTAWVLRAKGVGNGAEVGGRSTAGEVGTIGANVGKGLAEVGTVTQAVKVPINKHKKATGKHLFIFITSILNVKSG